MQRTGCAMRGDRRPGGGWGSQSRGECQRRKSARQAPGLAALKAAMSLASPGADSRALTSAAPSPSPVSVKIMVIQSCNHANTSDRGPVLRHGGHDLKK